MNQSSKRRKTVLTVKQKLETIAKVEKGESVQKLSMELGIGVQTVRDFMKQKDKLMQFTRVCNSGAASEKRKSVKKSTYEKLDACLIQWFNQKRSEGTPVSGPMCKEQALFFHNALNIEGSFNASSGWLTRFKKRYGIRDVCIKGEKLSGDNSAAELFKTEFRNYIKKEQLSLDQIFNADETGIYWKCLPSKTLVMQEEKEAPGFKTAKQRVTVLCCANASGTFRMKPLLVGKSKNPRSFGKNFENRIPVYYDSQASAWMNSQIFTKWFNSKFVPRVSEWLEKRGLPKKAVLLIDNAPCHPSNITSANSEIVLMFFPPNVTSLIQPMDQGVISAMKRIYRKNLLRQLLQEESFTDFWKKLTILDAVNLIAGAWIEVKSKTLKKSWNKLISDTADANCANEEITASDLIEVISGIEEFRSVNEENVEQWLKEDETDQGYQLLTDAEIVDAVTQEEAIKEQEEESGNNEVSAKVSHTEALVYADKLLDYMGQHSQFEYNDIIALRNIRQVVRYNTTEAHKQKNITDFFVKKN